MINEILFNPDKEPVSYIYRPWFTRNGIRYWAKNYGHKAWKIPIYE